MFVWILQFFFFLAIWFFFQQIDDFSAFICSLLIFLWCFLLSPDDFDSIGIEHGWLLGRDFCFSIYYLQLHVPHPPEQYTPNLPSSNIGHVPYNCFSTKSRPIENFFLAVICAFSLLSSAYREQSVSLDLLRSSHPWSLLSLLYKSE